MAKRTDIYQSPLSGRYASKEMMQLFSDDRKFSNWRKLWIALAEAEMELGKEEVAQEQIDEMKQYIYDINFDVADAREKVVRHDVMAHVYAYGQQCPKAKPIIHWGATSCYVTDNADVLNLRDALSIIRKRLLGVIKIIADTAEMHKNIPALGYTHYQTAAPVTIGKRESLWLYNFMYNLEELDFVLGSLKMLGCRGATGTSGTFMDIFEGDEEKVKRLDEIICKKFGFDEVVPVSGQTYPRIWDMRILNCLAGIAVSAQKMGKDIRLSQHDKEMEEPFEKTQIGSSAMAYKRNPMRSERVCSLARYVINMSQNAPDTAADQWMERTLDDSANRRMSIPEAFLATDAVLKLCGNIIDGIVVNEKVIERRLKEELPFLATENIIMEAVKKGGDRQELHEHIRVYSMEARERINGEGLTNNLLEKIAIDPIFNMTIEELMKICNPIKLTGRAANQVTDYLNEYVYPVLKANREYLTDINTEVSV